MIQLFRFCFRFTFWLCLLLLSACNHHLAQSANNTDFTHKIERREQSSLEQDYAAMRAKQIQEVHYTLQFQLDKTQTDFNGEATIDFVLAEGNRADITVDFNGGLVKQLTLDGKAIPWQHNGWFITLPADQITSGRHSLNIAFSHAYSTGDGLHRYVDNKTGNIYIYSNFEPFNANKMFPHFDQPNIKARYDLRVVAPADWQVISATREQETTLQNEFKRWVFPTSVAMSSYIFPLHAGPYHVWQDTFKKEDTEIPLRLFARQELAKYVVIDDWFTPTKQSFEFFNNYFELTYPFGKYDQIIVPDFNSGAMENLAAVTFSERYVVRGKKVKPQRAALANVIAHEMAHMWFGNLVTMDWWNGLWLNESFATYMAYLALHEASEFKNAWGKFYSSTKQWAYYTDQLVTTHPIELPVATTAEAFTNFDGITYGKGASVLKQLSYYLGQEHFRKGIALYLNEHSYGNTNLDDFIGALEQTSRIDLGEWTQQWLNTAGVNTLQASFECTNNKLSTLTLYQTAPQGMDLPTLRSQRVNIGLYVVKERKKNIEKGKLKIKEFAALPVLYSGAKTPVDLSAFKDLPCPDLVYPNVDDWGYVQVVLDASSSATLAKHINLFKKDLRVMLWQSMWDSVTNYTLSLDDFVTFAIANLPNEDSGRIVSLVNGQLVKAHHYYSLLDKNGDTYNAQRQNIAELFWEGISRQKPGSDMQKLYFDFWIKVASSAEHLASMRKLLMGEEDIPGLDIDQDRRWQLIIKLNIHGYMDIASLTEKEQKQDFSDRGKQMLLAAKAAQQGKENKDYWIAEITNKNSTYKFSELNRVMSNLFPVTQNSTLDTYSQALLDAIPELAASREDRFLIRYSSNLNKGTCSIESVTRLTRAITQYSHLHPGVSKQLRIAKQENERCLAIGDKL